MWRYITIWQQRTVIVIPRTSPPSTPETITGTPLASRRQCRRLPHAVLCNCVVCPQNQNQLCCKCSSRISDSECVGRCEMGRISASAPQVGLSETEITNVQPLDEDDDDDGGGCIRLAMMMQLNLTFAGLFVWFWINGVNTNNNFGCYLNLFSWTGVLPILNIIRWSLLFICNIAFPYRQKNKKNIDELLRHFRK